MREFRKIVAWLSRWANVGRRWVVKSVSFVFVAEGEERERVDHSLQIRSPFSMCRTAAAWLSAMFS